MSFEDRMPRPSFFEGQSLGSGMSLNDLPGALRVHGGEILNDIERQMRSVADLPGDVYRTVVQVPDESATRKHLVQMGAGALSIVVPVTRAITRSAELVPHARFLQPILLGKLFGIHDYLQDRQDALLALPTLPKQIRDDAVRLREFLRAHPDIIAAAAEAMPGPEALRRLGSSGFWSEAAHEHWQQERARIDAHYEGIVSREDRRQRDLPCFRAAYVLAYHGLAFLDPVKQMQARLTPDGIEAYQAWLRRQAQIEQVAQRLIREFPEAAPADPALAQDHAPTRPQRPAIEASTPAASAVPLTEPKPASLGPQLSAAPLDEELPTGPMAPAEVPAPQGAGHLGLTDPGLGADPVLVQAPLPKGATAQPLVMQTTMPPGPAAPKWSAAPDVPLPRTAPAAPRLQLPAAMQTKALSNPTAPATPASLPDTKAPW